MQLKKRFGNMLSKNVHAKYGNNIFHLFFSFLLNFHIRLLHINTQDIVFTIELVFGRQFFAGDIFDKKVPSVSDLVLKFCSDVIQ